MTKDQTRQRPADQPTGEPTEQPAAPPVEQPASAAEADLVEVEFTVRSRGIPRGTRQSLPAAKARSLVDRRHARYVDAE